MESIRSNGRLLHLNNPLCESVTFNIRLHKDPEDTLYTWHGEMTLPPDNNFDFAEHAFCEIRLEDGRSGAIITTRPNGNPHEFEFIGSGPLQ